MLASVRNIDASASDVWVSSTSRSLSCTMILVSLHFCDQAISTSVTLHDSVPPPHTHTFPLANAECPIPYSHEPFDILKLHAPGCTHSLTEHNYSDFEAYITAVKTVLSKVRLSARFSLCLMWLVMTANTMWTSWNSLCTTVRRLYAGLLISTEWRTIELTFCLPATWTLSDAGSCVTALCFRHCFISSWLLEKWTEWLKHQFN